ncbi:MAG: DUF4258 domain-containing protein [Bacteroidetes bacterium]|nr:DUF4258 domain-containing protein [Bacteroidota bacterium]
MEAQNIQITSHARKRAAQRGISIDMIVAAINYGQLIYKQGLRYYICLEKNILGILPPSLIDHYKNTVIILSTENELITCYKNENALSKIKRKAKRVH